VQAFIDLSYPRAPHTCHRPKLESYDSSEECSFYHFSEVLLLVEEGDASSADEEMAYSQEIEEAFQETMSEVEPATAYQHFAGNVV
jgi:hypothetical protein